MAELNFGLKGDMEQFFTKLMKK